MNRIGLVFVSPSPYLSLTIPCTDTHLFAPGNTTLQKESCIYTNTPTGHLALDDVCIPYAPDMAVPLSSGEDTFENGPTRTPCGSDVFALCIDDL